MSVSASEIMIQVVGGYQGGAEPWEKTASLRIDEAGFHDTHLVGYSGDDRASADPSATVAALLNEFEGASLLRLLDDVVRLRAAVAAANADR